MTVFHICSDYAKQALYGRLLRALSQYTSRQFMYVPVRSAQELEVGRITDDPRIQFRYAHLLRPHHRLMFRAKVRRVLADITEHTVPAQFRLVHAHFLYSDGAVALGLKERFGLPFVVAVRNTDINYFMRLRPDLAALRDRILCEAARIVFLSPAYRDTCLQRLPATVAKRVQDKALVVPNGLGDEWLEEVPTVDRPPAPLKLLYVGDFTANKNVPGIVRALRILQRQREATLTLVGGGGDAGGEVARLIQEHRENGVTAEGKVNDAQRLRALYRQHDVFVMPSFRETFGLAYIEALSQGLPIVHSEGQGVDGYFAPQTVAAAVDPTDPDAIARGVLEVAQRLPALQAECRREAKRFSWRSVAQCYHNTYRSILDPSR